MHQLEHTALAFYWLWAVASTTRQPIHRAGKGTKGKRPACCVLHHVRADGRNRPDTVYCKCHFLQFGYKSDFSFATECVALDDTAGRLWDEWCTVQFA